MKRSPSAPMPERRLRVMAFVAGFSLPSSCFFAESCFLVTWARQRFLSRTKGAMPRRPEKFCYSKIGSHRIRTSPSFWISRSLTTGLSPRLTQRSAFRTGPLDYLQHSPRKLVFFWFSYLAGAFSDSGRLFGALLFFYRAWNFIFLLVSSSSIWS